MARPRPGAGDRRLLPSGPARVGEGRAHLDNLLLLLLLRFLAAPGLGLLLGGHGGGRWHRPDRGAAGHRPGTRPRARQEGETRAAVAAAPHVKRGARSPPQRGLCDRSARQSIVGREGRRPEAEVRMRRGRSGPGVRRDRTWEKDGASPRDVAEAPGPSGAAASPRRKLGERVLPPRAFPSAGDGSPLGPSSPRVAAEGRAAGAVLDLRGPRATSAPRGCWDGRHPGACSCPGGRGRPAGPVPAEGFEEM